MVCMIHKRVHMFTTLEVAIDKRGSKLFVDNIPQKTPKPGRPMERPQQPGNQNCQHENPEYFAKRSRR